MGLNERLVKKNPKSRMGGLISLAAEEVSR